MPDPKRAFPWRNDNCFELLSEGERFLPVMVAAIGAARSHVLLELYLLTSGRVLNRFIEALLGASRRGVRCWVLVDGFGARGLRPRDQERLRQAGVALVWYNPLRYGALFGNFVRDHRKILVIDGRVAFTGGFGFTDHFIPAGSARSYWREVAVQAEGPVVSDWQALFAATWKRVTGETLRLHAPAVVVSPAGQVGRVACSRGFLLPDIQRAWLHHISRATRRVWLATAYFVPSMKMRRVLKRAGRRGVDVRLLLPGPITDHPAVRHAGRRFYGRLLRHGVRIFEYQPRFVHMKITLCDDWVSLGSANVDHWTARWNLEANQEIFDAGFAAEVAAMLLQDFAACREITWEYWSHRPWYRRLLERFWGWADVWVLRLFGRGRLHRAVVKRLGR
ncbi:MAG TPA: phosphatidylserine/phosphatidylglycerophosphate/cardiolipin synthase family protein [Gammaproteobacteria bacterium]|nr:phosphatidylserine/phosphatidylglycerophosphate/cardiolipin synthase family protein [Gammaproteobacteria bacterium]